MGKKTGDHRSPLQQFDAVGVSYSAAAAEMGLPRSTLYMALHGQGKVNQKRVLPIVKNWIAARRRKTFYKTAPMATLLAKRGITIGGAAAAIGLTPEALGKAVYSGEWESEADFQRFQKYLDEKKFGEAKKMLTKISLPEDVLDYFGLKRDPFTNEMEGNEDILDTKELARAEKKIVNAAEKGGWIAITGPVGSGKSTLIKKVEAKLAKDRKVVIVKPRTIEKQFLGASHVCDSIIQDLGVNDLNNRRTLEHKARLVGRVLEEAYKDNRRVIVLIDEAHLLRVDALLALKRIYEFELGFKKLLSIILVGQDFLARNLKTNFQLSEVSQRVDLYELGSLNGSLGAYVRHKLDRAGAGAREIFDSSAFKAIGERFDTPLAVNNVAAAALLAAHDCGEKHVNAEIVRSIQGSY